MSRPPRDPRVWLAAAEPRCEPSALPACDRYTCARYLAPLPPSGATLADFNVNRAFYSLACGHWLSADQARPVPAAPVRRVHPPLGRG